MVSLFSNDQAYCGMGYLMTSLSAGFESSAFTVVNHECATGYYSFAHELGHNMGCHHDRDNATTGLYPYSYGWRFTGVSGSLYRTIMAYAPGTRVQRFSNPDVTYDGVPTGVPIGFANQSHNAATINNSAYTVANFRQSRVLNQPAGLTPGSTSPDGSVVVSTSPVTLRWNAVTGADRYEVQSFYWNAVSSSWVAMTTQTTTGTSLNLSLPAASTHYAWAVRAGNSTTWSALSAWAYFYYSTTVTCSYAISPGSASFPSGGGVSSVAVTASGSCNWSASSQASWIKILSAPTGSGNGTVTYQVASNKGKKSRTGSVSIAGRTFTVTQAAK
jgi:hypothetical protein